MAKSPDSADVQVPASWEELHDASVPSLSPQGQPRPAETISVPPGLAPPNQSPSEVEQQAVPSASGSTGTPPKAPPAKVDSDYFKMCLQTSIARNEQSIQSAPPPQHNYPSQSWHSHFPPPPPPPPAQSSSPPTANVGGEEVAACVTWIPDKGTGQLLLCLRCDGGRLDSLLPQASNLLCSALECDTSACREDNMTDWNLDTWSIGIAMKVTAIEGPARGISAIGTGANVKMRRRVARLALALAVASDPSRRLLDGDCPSSTMLLQELLGHARLKRELAQTQQAAGVLAPSGLLVTSNNHAASSTAPPVAVGAVEAARQPQPLSLAHQAAAGTTLALVPLQQAPVTTSVALAQAFRHPGIPPECLQDPYMELRSWGDGGTQWPYCTLCNSWSDTPHLNSSKHKRRLANAGFELGPTGVLQHPQQLSITNGAPATASVTPLPLPPISPSSSWAGAVEASLAPLPAQSSSVMSGGAERVLPQAELHKSAPPRPTRDEIFDWNYPWVEIDWNSIQSW